MTDQLAEQTETVARSIFIGAVPERSNDLNRLWSENDLRFTILSSLEHSPVMEGGAYREVRFNHRAMRAFWVASFAAWEGMEVYLCSLGIRRVAKQNLDRFRELLKCVSSIITDPDPTMTPLPKGIPNPGQFAQEPKARAPGELAVFAVAWALLHEIHHIKRQRDGTSTTDSSIEEQYQEEFSCDEFAVRYLLDKVETYSDIYREPNLLVKMKRRTGLHFGLFALTVLANELPQKWNQSGSHPSIQSRIDKLWNLIQDGEFDSAALYSLAAFRSLQLVWPSSPCPKLSICKILKGIMLHIKKRFLSRVVDRIL